MMPPPSAWNILALVAGILSVAIVSVVSPPDILGLNVASHIEALANLATGKFDTLHYAATAKAPLGQHHCDSQTVYNDEFRFYKLQVNASCCISPVPHRAEIIFSELGDDESFPDTIPFAFPWGGDPPAPANTAFWISSNGFISKRPSGSTSVPRESNEDQVRHDDGMDQWDETAAVREEEAEDAAMRGSHGSRSGLAVFWRDLIPVPAESGVIQRWLSVRDKLINCVTYRWANFVDTIGLNPAAFRAELCENGLVTYQYEIVGSGDGAVNGIRRGQEPAARYDISEGQVLRNMCFQYSLSAQGGD
eukprot:GHVS01039822.1.p1 GENE.GHVS01039822.1~~GHVS01039822.1.p1  ORF type:complete len:306 (-),score=36.89 GHVS01039822.1:309-1226(-)